MATFSPSPGPRPRRMGQISPTAVRGRSRGPSTRPSSRLATPALASPTAHNDNASVDSTMDVDEDANSLISDRSGRVEILYAKSEEVSVAFYASLPGEVKQVLKSADFFVQSYTGEVDTITGFSLIASSRTCFVWQHAQAVKTSPTCYIFSCPGRYNRDIAPFHELVPSGSSREPGLILMSASGEIRFWDSIGIGLAGGENFSRSFLDLDSREIVTNLVRADPQTYLVSTSFGRLFRLNLTSSGGKYQLAIHGFSRPLQSLSLTSLIPGIWSKSVGVLPTKGNTNAITLGATTATGIDVWALVETRVQKWNMSTEGWEEIVLDQDIGNIIRPAIRGTYPSAPLDDSSLDLELLDFAFEKHSLVNTNLGRMVVLISYAGKEDSMGVATSDPRRVYALVWVSYSSGAFSVENVSSVPYQSTSASGAPLHPRLQLVHLGALIIIQFGDAVAFCARDSEYRHRLELKSATDRTLGVGVVGSENAVLVLTAANTMRASLDMDHIHNFNPETGQANLIKSIMMQAIVYGSIAENPLNFSFPPEVDEEGLMRAAEQLSAAVLESDHEVVKRNHDLSWQMAGRKERLSWLIGFINENAVLGKMSQRSRQQLAIDAEKLSACYRLWQQHNEQLLAGNVRSILDEAVSNFMTAVGEGHHEDVLRAFFRLRVADIGPLLIEVVATAKKASHEVGRGMANVLPEANSALVTILGSAIEWREYNKGVYGLQFPMINPWTSTPSILNSILDLFYSTTRLIDTASDATNVAALEIANLQLPELAQIILQCFNERLEWLGSPIAGEEPGIERERQELFERFASLRSEVLNALCKHNHSGFAFTLAERYSDFRNLAALCHKDKIYPPNENPNALRIHEYMEKFKDKFANELFNWYIEHGELRVLFAQEDLYGAQLDRFLDKHHHATAMWIRDLGKRRHGAAANCLLHEARKVSHLATKHLMLSIGKLCHLAQVQENEGALDQKTLDAFHYDLDFVSVHDDIIAEMKDVLKNVRTKQSLDVQADTIAQKKATKLKNMPALFDLFKKLIRQLLQGKALSIEDVVDVLTLKDNTKSVMDYSTALHLLSQDDRIPVARRLSAFRAVWRRIYLHDDWAKIRQTRNITDIELNERFEKTALYTALTEVLLKENRPEGYHLYLDKALLTPSVAEVSSRWPGMSPDEVEALGTDYQRESDRVKELGLEDVYDRVRELASLREDDVFR